MNGHTQEQDAAILQLLTERFITQGLPLALSLKEKVDRGEKLSDFDLQVLQQIFNNAQQSGRYFSEHEEYGSIISKTVELYHHITEKALENETLSD